MVGKIQFINKIIIQSVAGISHPAWLLGVSDLPREGVFEHGLWCWIALMLKVYQQVLQEVLWKSRSRSVVMTQVSEHQCFTRRIFWILNSEWDVTWCFLIDTIITLSLDHLSSEFIRNFHDLISAVQISYVQYDVHDQLRKSCMRMCIGLLAWMQTWTSETQGRLLH